MYKRGRDRGKFSYYGLRKWRPPNFHKLIRKVPEHDDRDFSVPSGSGRKVSFKGSHGGREGRRNRQSSRDTKLRNAFLLDSDDVDMNNPGGRNLTLTRVVRYPVNRGLFGGVRGPRHSRDSPVPGSRYKALQESGFSWYKVMIPNGNKYDKEYLLRILMGYIRPYTFVPYGFRRVSEDISFYVDDFVVAEQLMAADRKITTNDGHKVRIQIRPNMPFIEVDDKLRDKIKLVMSKRYQVETQALDLRKFHADPDFIAEDLFVPLNRHNLLFTVVNIICDMIPELQALDLSDNRLAHVDILKPLVEKVPNLKVLHLANSKIRSVSQFECLQGLPLEDLNIDGNPVCDKFKDQSAYVREVRKRFPKIIKLDGTDLPPPIVFDVEDETPLMRSRGSFFCDVNGRNIVRQFLEQYYTIFDSDSRQPLIDAYHENAQFSLTCTPGLSSYVPDSRNLLIVSHLDKRVRLLRQGRSSIIAFLTSLIKTQHDPTSFAVDLLLFSPQLIYISVAGVYREPTSNKKLPIRSFSRVFIIVPAGTGFCIVNDMFSITNANPDQAKEAFKLSVAPAPAQQPPPPPPVMVSPVAAVPVISSPANALPLVPNANVETQRQMVATLAAQTGMNLAWSEKCLNETNWNFENALFIFSELNKQGKVPAEAFVK